MSASRTAFLALAAALLLSSQQAFPAIAAGKSAGNANKDLSNASCQTCHATGQKEIQVGTGDQQRKLRAIPTDRFGKGVHGTLDCVACHTDITDAKAKHSRTTVARVDCAQCHIDLLAKARQEQHTPQKLAALEKVVKNAEAYKQSFHARPDADHPERPKASCDNCHDTHTFLVPERDTVAYKKWRQSIPNLCGDACHTDHVEEWSESAHGLKAQERSEGKAAVCTDCHSAHDVVNTSGDTFKLSNVRECGNCHEKQMASYRDTYHGQVNELGYTYTAKCKDCHGSHGILKSSDPSSKLHPDNRLKTCKSCHDGKKAALATEGFKTYGPHAHAHDKEKYPQVWYVTRFMGALMIGVFAYFWLHCLLWWFREHPRGQERRSEHRIREADALRAAAGTKTHIRRFGAVWRIAHLCFALSVMTLILTGITVLYSDTAWAPAVAKLFGGPKTMGLVHRVAAAIMLSIFFLHLIGVTVNIVRNRKTFRFFGPDSLVPRWQDFAEAWGMFKWFVHKGPRPVFDRWTYWEKFDYWAVFWGMAIIGSSGMMLAFPHITAQYLPGWVFNVATLVHGEEAFLAAVFLFTVHFFNNHFRPDKLPPPDVVMFTGTVSVDEFRREHGAHYQRLVETGELEKHLVEAPSRGFTLRSKALGLVLIGIGLTLLIMVFDGFLRSI